MSKTSAPNVAGLTIGDIQKLVNELHSKAQNVPLPKQPKGERLWLLGKSYLLRTVSNHFTGRFVGFNGPNDSELLFDNAAWVADTGRFMQAVADGVLNEVEPYPANSIIGINRSAVVDGVQIAWPLPRSQK